VRKLLKNIKTAARHPFNQGAMFGTSMVTLVVYLRYRDSILLEIPKDVARSMGPDSNVPVYVSKFGDFIVQKIPGT
jgi:hypothetical protein